MAWLLFLNCIENIRAQKTLPDISKEMTKIDLCMLTTKSGRGALMARPMSNNGDVEYDGISYFFTFKRTGKIRDIKRDP